MKGLLIDCSSGISGDMFLSALSGLGCDFAPLEKAFHAAGAKLAISARHVGRASGPGVATEISWTGGRPPRGLRDLHAIVARLDVSVAVREKSAAMLKRLAEAHGAAPDEAHFHEAGAAETLAGVVGAAWGLEQLGVREVICRPLPWFGGFAEGGRLPLPSPAVLALIIGKPCYESGAGEGFITLTGALLLNTLVDSFVPAGRLERLSGGLPDCGVFEASGLGYESREPDAESGRPGRELRLHLFSMLHAKDDETPCTVDEVYKISCPVAHLSDEEIGRAIGKLIEAGALDAFRIPGAAGELCVFCAIDMLLRIEREIFERTSSLGISISRQARVTRARKPDGADAPRGLLDVKECGLLNQAFTVAEYEGLVETAARVGISLPPLLVLDGEKGGTIRQAQPRPRATLRGRSSGP